MEVSPQKPPAGGRRGIIINRDGPKNNMGETIWSLDSMEDFPPPPTHR